MNEQTYAGLSENEANEALCVWLSQKGEDRPRRTYMVYGYLILAPGTKRGPNKIPFFSHSHDSIHRVLDAMNDEERVAFRRALIDVLADAQPADKGANLVVLALFATPAQKCVAALRALGLTAQAEA